MPSKINHRETAESIAFMQWASYQPRIEPYLIHIPNERATSAQRRILGAMGVTSGVWDYFLSVARGGYFGLWCEMKAPKPHGRKPSDRQITWGELVDGAGYATAVAFGAGEAIAAVEAYMLLPPTQVRRDTDAAALRAALGRHTVR